MSHDPQAWALVRYQVIAPYIAAQPPRGQRGSLLRQLAARVWTGPDGEPFSVAAETIRTWVRRYRTGGLHGLRDAPRRRTGVLVLTDEQQELVCRLKREVPQRSLDRIIEIAEGLQLIEPGTLKRSTVHRVLRRHGLSARGGRIPDRKDLDDEQEIYYPPIMDTIARIGYDLYVGHEFTPKADPIAAMKAAFDTCDITV